MIINKKKFNEYILDKFLIRQRFCRYRCELNQLLYKRERTWICVCRHFNNVFLLTFSFFCDLTLNSGRMICLENFAISLLFSSGSLSISGKLGSEQSLTGVYIFQNYTSEGWFFINGGGRDKKESFFNFFDTFYQKIV